MPTPVVAVHGAVSAAYPSRNDTPVHGDLYARHLLIGNDRQPAGVIDRATRI